MGILDCLTPAVPKRSRNDRDMAAQLGGIAALTARHKRTLDAAWPGPTSADGQSIAAPPGMCRLYDTEELGAALARAREKKDMVLINALDKAAKLGALRTLAGAPSAADLLKLGDDFPNCADVVALVERRRALAEVTPGREFRMPPILLSGPPGVGKTAFVERLAACLAVPFRRLDIAVTTAGFALSGSHASWSDAQPGAVWALLQAPCVSGILLLDEIDKPAQSRYPVLGALYTLLETASARHFRDECVDIQIDASNLFWVGTCNDSNGVEAALRNRFTEFEIAKPTPTQMVAVVRSAHHWLRAHMRWALAFDEELPADVLEALGELSPRAVIRALEDGHARAAADGRRQLRRRDIVVPSTPNQRRIGFIQGPHQ